MTVGARTPEELDPLLEDAFVLRDREAFRLLFAQDALLAEAGGLEARGENAIGRALAAFCAADRVYVATPARVLRARETALVVSGSGIHVLRRGDDQSWRSGISLLHLPPPMTEVPR